MQQERQAEDYLRNYSQEDDFDSEWQDKNSIPSPNVKKVQSHQRLRSYYTEEKEGRIQVKSTNPFPIREKHPSERANNKKASLPQIPFPVLGGNPRYSQLPQYFPPKSQMLAKKCIEKETRTEREDHNELIQRLIEKESIKLKLEERATFNGNGLMKNYHSQQDQRGSTKTYRSLKKLHIRQKTTDHASNRLKQNQIPFGQSKPIKRLTLINLFNYLS